jgi:hypothetical protein
LEKLPADLYSALVNAIKSDELVTNEAVAACCEDIAAQKGALFGDTAEVYVAARADLSKVILPLSLVSVAHRGSSRL